jgi:hypothetical protein
MFDDVNQICKDKNIKLVNILPFIDNAGNELDFSNRHSDCLYNLFKVTEKEMDMGGYGDVRSTHLTDENNRILADIILDRFAEGKNVLMDLFKDGDFIYSKDITQRYVDMGYDFQREIGMIKSLLIKWSSSEIVLIMVMDVLTVYITMILVLNRWWDLYYRKIHLANIAGAHYYRKNIPS